MAAPTRTASRAGFEAFYANHLVGAGFSLNGAFAQASPRPGPWNNSGRGWTYAHAWTERCWVTWQAAVAALPALPAPPAGAACPFTEGVVYACARVVDLFDQPTIAQQILAESRVDPALGCEDDLVVLRKAACYRPPPQQRGPAPPPDAGPADARGEEPPRLALGHDAGATHLPGPAAPDRESVPAGDDEADRVIAAAARTLAYQFYHGGIQDIRAIAALWALVRRTDAGASHGASASKRPPLMFHDRQPSMTTPHLPPLAAHPLTLAREALALAVQAQLDGAPMSDDALRACQAAIAACDALPEPGCEPGVEPATHGMAFALCRALEASGWHHAGSQSPHLAVMQALVQAGIGKHEHPNLDVPLDPACSRALDGLGDSRGQGLDGFWKWGFRSGWHLTTTHEREGAPDRPWHDAVLDECMKVDGCYVADDPATTLASLLDWHAAAGGVRWPSDPDDVPPMPLPHAAPRARAPAAALTGQLCFMPSSPAQLHAELMRKGDRVCTEAAAQLRELRRQLFMADARTQAAAPPAPPAHAGATPQVDALLADWEGKDALAALAALGGLARQLEAAAVRCEQRMAPLMATIAQAHATATAALVRFTIHPAVTPMPAAPLEALAVCIAQLEAAGGRDGSPGR